MSEAYPKLYGKTSMPFMSLEEVGFREKDNWSWGSKNWLMNEDDDNGFVLAELTELLSDTTMVQNESNVCVWINEVEEGLIVKSYASLI